MSVEYRITCLACGNVHSTNEKVIHLLKRCPGCGASVVKQVQDLKGVAERNRLAMVRQMGDALKGIIADAGSTPEEFYWDWMVQIGRKTSLMDEFIKAAR